ncbi:hypothetical protein [Sporosarcina limicola]|uniref:Chromosome segregation ATPase n=1 Tax=Sporosarcina limicola TaxID=34101 RepID=A0A927R4Z9_9BACL|nr:hypothetical protein [Sporosarcina limicola]MBE1556786.1 chromosome segregation ATPase [Sporosarcina limicola]
MNSEYIKNNDPLQLQQMIIFLKAELAKYKYEVEKYKDGYHYSLVEELEQENLQLTNEKNELSEELYKLNQEFEKRTRDYKESVHSHEMQRKKYVTSIDALRKTKTDLRPINKQLSEVIKKLKVGFNTDQYRNRKHDRQVTLLHKKLSDNKTTIEQLEYKLVDLIQEANKQVHTQIEKLDVTNNERIQSEKVSQYLLKEIEEKNDAIMKLQKEISDLKEQNEKNNNTSTLVEKSLSQMHAIQAGMTSCSSTDTPTVHSETFMQVEHQMKNVLAQSLDYEEKLGAKLLILNDLELKLENLTEEIADIKVLNLGGKILRKF